MDFLAEYFTVTAPEESHWPGLWFLRAGPTNKVIFVVFSLKNVHIVKQVQYFVAYILKDTGYITKKLKIVLPTTYKNIKIESCLVCLALVKKHTAFTELKILFFLIITRKCLIIMRSQCHKFRECNVLL